MKSVCRFLKSKRILGAASALAITFAAPANAEEEKTRNFSIEAQPLAMALVEFSRQSDITVIAPSKTTRGLQSRAVVGEMEPTEALETLLGEADLELRARRDRAIILAQAGEGNAPIRETQIEEDAGSFAVSEDEGDVFQQLEEIVVTGTNIRGVENPTTPILQFDRDDIELSGAGTVEDFLRTIPQNFLSETQLTSDSGNPNSSGRNNTLGTVIDLRGLGAGSTLTLLNGRRMAYGGQANFVDVSILPVGSIDRIDVLTDGASAIYGSDAVGGVVNFITRRDYEGFEVNTRYGTVTDGSKEDFGIGVSGGLTWGTGGGLVGVDYQTATPLLTSERDFVDQDTVTEGSNFGAETDRLSLTGSFNQQFGSRLSAAIDILHSDLQAESNDITVGTFVTDRAEQKALFVNSRLEYTLTDSLAATLFFDYGQNKADTSTSSTNFDDIISFDNELFTIEGQLSGVLSELPGGEMAFSVGGLYREEQYDNFTNFSDNSLNAKRDVAAAYIETLVPIIGEGNSVPLVQRLQISAAGRYEDYSDFGDSFDPKIGIFWEVNDELSFRGSYSQSFRVPDLQSVNQPVEYFILGTSRVFFTSVTPPDAEDRLPRDNEVVLLVPFQGNPDLKPETADTWSGGFNYSPKFVEGLQIGVNYFDIDYTNRLESVSLFEPIQIPEFGVLVEIPPNPSTVSALFADAEAGIVSIRDLAFLSSGATLAEDIQVIINAGIRNLSKREVRGVDFGIDYQKSTDVGEIGFGLNATYLLDFIGQVSELADPVDQRNILFRPVDLTLRTNVSWSNNGFTVFAAVNHRDSYQDKIDDPIANDIDAWTTVDLSFVYDTSGRVGNWLFSDVRLGLNITNLFDEDPPFVETPSGINFDSANANPFGRQANLSLTKRF